MLTLPPAGSIGNRASKDAPTKHRPGLARAEHRKVTRSDFSGHPRRMVCLGTYLVVLAGTVGLMALLRWSAGRAADPAA